jgi:hypothetical protein
MKCTATEDDVDVFTSGYVFRLKILHERGLSLVRKEGKNSESDIHIYRCACETTGCCLMKPMNLQLEVIKLSGSLL